MENETTNVPAAARIEALPTLFARLADQLTQLFDAKVALLRVELREELQTYLRNGVLLVAGGAVALIGFALLNIALAFLISLVFANTHLDQAAKYGFGFIIAAVVYLAAGAVLIVRAKNQIKKQGFVPPRTAAELARDKEFLNDRI